MALLTWRGGVAALLHAPVVAPFGNDRSIRIHYGGSAVVNDRQIWAASSGALKEVLQMHRLSVGFFGTILGENLVFGRWPEPVMVTPLALFPS